jgi:hypothetical protein
MDKMDKIDKINKMASSPAGHFIARSAFTLWLCCLLLAVSCIKEKQEAARTIVLSAPEDNNTYDLAAVPSVSFTWSLLDDIDRYRIVFSRSESMAPAVTVEAAVSPYAVPVTKLDEALKNLGMANEETDTVYWSVRSTPILMNIETQVRTLMITRMPLSPVTLFRPDDGVTINAGTTAFPIAFTWKRHDEILDYTVLFSTDYTFPNGKTAKVDRGANISYTLATAADFDNLLQQAGVSSGQSATVYWIVIATGGVPNGTPRSFTGHRQ